MDRCSQTAELRGEPEGLGEPSPRAPAPNEQPLGTAPSANGKAAVCAHYLKRTIWSSNSLAILDQAVVSGTRFLTLIILGRACGPHELGDYSLGFTLYCLGACIQTGFISLPFTIYSHYVQGDERHEYAGSVLAHFAMFELLVMAVLGLATGVLALGYGPTGLAPLAGMLAIAFPLALIVEFARRFALAGLELTKALAIDVAMSAIQIGGLLLLASLGQLSAEGAFAAMGLGGAIAGLTWLALARRQFVICRARILADALRNWRFGRWSLASQLLLVARAAAVLWLLALVVDPTSTGIFVACDTLVRLSAPLLLAVANVLFPSAARAVAQGDMSEVRRLTRRAALGLGTATALLFALFVWFGDSALTVLYGEAYGAQGTVLSLLALAMIADALEIVATNGLLALERSDVNFVANLLGTVLTLVISAVLVPWWGIVGAAWGSLLGRTVTSAVVWVTFLRLARRKPGGPDMKESARIWANP